jgi:hypothetical protein
VLVVVVGFKHAQELTRMVCVCHCDRNQLKTLVGLDNITELLGFLDTLYGDMVKRYDNMLAEVRGFVLFCSARARASVCAC